MRFFLTTYDDFIDAFFKSSNSGDGLKTGTRRQYSLFSLFKLDAFTEKMLKKRREDPFLVMKQEFQRLIKKGIQPVVIIDEFHKLDGLYMPDKQKRLMVELMNFFVALTKESHLCHVIIASSDAFFVEQVYVDSKLCKTSKFMKLDYLEKNDVFAWLRDIKKYNKVQKYTLLRHFSKQPARNLTELAGTSKDLLGQTVRDNILYYDPVDGIYGIQGKSLEWGIKEYFDKMDISKGLAPASAA
ncbi:MAG: hypothetical protein B1H11_12730 [Desulfobacteraceae bacterium 4484_190.1]|nr:MAG: hypothetical protein B1H11_12730 [Desulfobacteraceae bacterium 4484_190.1]